MRNLLVLALVACSSSSHPAPPQQVGDHGVDVANLRAQLPPYLASVDGGLELHALSGFVLVAQHDQVLYAQGFGYANRETRRAPTADTSFRSGDQAVHRRGDPAARAGWKLSVQDTVGKHLPCLTGPAKDVTIHQLLTHTAGIPNYTADPTLMENRAAPIDVRELVASFAAKPLDFTPGTEFRYSNSGYILLGAIIEAASGMTYKQYLEAKLFGPARLAHTEVGDAIGVADRAEGYSLDGDKLAPRTQSTCRFRSPPARSARPRTISYAGIARWPATRS